MYVCCYHVFFCAYQSYSDSQGININDTNNSDLDANSANCCIPERDEIDHLTNVDHQRSTGREGPLAAPTIDSCNNEAPTHLDPGCLEDLLHQQGNASLQSQSEPEASTQTLSQAGLAQLKDLKLSY